MRAAVIRSGRRPSGSRMVNSSEDESPQKGASPEEYDHRYFMSCLGGYKEFRVSEGRTLGPRFQKALRLAGVRPGQRILDIGCGRGELVIQSALRGAEAVGIDYADVAVSIVDEALASYPEEVRRRVSVLLMDARSMAFDAGSFDTVFMSDIVEHLHPQELNEVLAETRRLLKPRGKLIIHTTPNRLFYDVTYPVYIRHVHRTICRLAELGGYMSYVIGPTLSVGPRFPRLPEELRQHVNEQTAGSLARTLKESGFRVAKKEHWEIRNEWPYVSRRLTIELMILDSLRFLRPFSYYWPLNKVFTNHIWMVAEKR
jgi:2-polyprenyl-3-methyl-5-hydroxy-6-metoxy-1,4-benzoquinol methylase